MSFKKDQASDSTGLHQKKKSTKNYNVFSARIGEHNRALCYVENNIAKWFWIGSHEQYNKVISKLKDVVKNN